MHNGSTTDYDALIIGGGPAGQAAAIELANLRLRCAVIDEQARPGGQILRQPPASFEASHWAEEASYRPLKQQLHQFETQSGIDWLGRRSVIGLQSDGTSHSVLISGANGLQQFTAPHVLIAAGCYDLPVAIPGWTLPGAMGAGAMQTLLKAQGILTGERIALAGTHPLMLLIAAQIHAAGGTVAEVAFDQPFTRFAKAMGRNLGTGLRHAGLLAEAGKAMLTLRRAGVPVRFGRKLQGIIGREQVAGAIFAAGATEEQIACDSIGLCYGFLPQSDLLRQAGLAVEWAAPAGGWAARHDDWMQSSTPGLWVAGETTGVAGAPIAREEGRIAGLGIARALERITPEDAAEQAKSSRTVLRKMAGFADLLAGLADPREALTRIQPPETLICRCENVSAAAIGDVLRETQDANAIKRITRCGMGACQGRSCEHALLRMIARETGQSVGQQPGFTARFPARPVSIGDLLEHDLQ
ncbi:NAD(P)/FAD-dependent oxidoreductase [Altericroceibacterium endophyticum]|nr:NAD(P)/FAD-dependent oxidoreductase [Altericroceibacterium endophyticum]